MQNRSWTAAALLMVSVLSPALVGCGQQTPAWDVNAGVVLQPVATNQISRLRTAVAAASNRSMRRSGIGGVMGALQVKALRGGDHSLSLPIPQLTDCQAPIAYIITSTPHDALAEARIQNRGERGVFLCLKLKATPGQEVKFDWAAAVLIGSKPFVTNATPPEAYLSSTPCAQAEDKRIKQLAEKIWPADDKADEFARHIQAFIASSKPKNQLLSLDALGILASGRNDICTANANLAAALMRTKHLPCRSIAMVPLISQRLEMHRVVEYLDHGQWSSFDPSSVQPDVPMPPSAGIIMAKTTIEDERDSMKPRMGSALGCPFGQEVELSDIGLTLSGNEFFWTIAAPLAEFEVNAEAASLAMENWTRFLKSGVSSTESFKAAAAKNLDEFRAAWKTPPRK